MPLQTHGDEAAVRKGLVGLVAMIASWGSPLSARLKADMSVLLTFLLVMKCVVDGTLECLMDVLRWSFMALRAGTHPYRDHHNKEFQPGSKRWKLRGKPLAGGAFGIAAEHLGDWKFLKECFRLLRHQKVL